jgi:hypothetical protein
VAADVLHLLPEHGSWGAGPTAARGGWAGSRSCPGATRRWRPSCWPASGSSSAASPGW